MEPYLNQIREVLFQIGFLPIVVVIALFALYVYWKESVKTGKNQNSIFDGYFLSAIVMVIWGRFTYILTNPIDYEGLIWSFIPYERYPDGFFLFRLLPWRYFRIWDGEFLFTGLFIGFILAAFIFSTIYKRWRWREMMGTVIFTASTYMGLLLFVSGFLVENADLLKQGLITLIITIGYFIVSNLFRKIFQLKRPKFFEKLNYYLIFIFSLVVSYYIPSALLQSDITNWDRFNLNIFAIFSVCSHIIFIIDLFRKSVKIKTEYKTRSVNISANQPIKI
jgi:hypothetical protein